MRIYYPLQAHQVDREREHTVICVSRLRYEKGIDVLLQAWRLVQQQDPLARLIIVGGGPLAQQFLSMTEALGIGGSVEFTGVQNDVAGQLRRGGLAVLPSRWEGMPNALLEAMGWDAFEHIGRNIAIGWLSPGKAQFVPWESLTDEELAVRTTLDTASAAAVAWACTASSPTCEPERLEEFWKWWLNEVIPAAWEKSAQDTTT